MVDKHGAIGTPRGNPCSGSPGLKEPSVGSRAVSRHIAAAQGQHVAHERARTSASAGTRHRSAKAFLRSVLSACVAAMVLGTVAALLAAAPAQAQTRTLSIERGPFPASISTADGGVYLRYRISSDQHSWWDNCGRGRPPCIPGVRDDKGHAVGEIIEWERPWPGKALTGHGGGGSRRSQVSRARIWV